MLDKIRDVIQVAEKLKSIDAYSEKTLEQSTYVSHEISQIKEELEELHGSIDVITNAQKEFAEQSRKVMEQLSETNEEFQQDLSDFKLVKGKLQQNLMENLIAEFRQELLQHVEKLKVDMHSYNELKDKVQFVTSKTVGMMQQFQKLTDISKNIRKEDFELKNVAKQLSDADSEKLRLMKRVDMLERLLSKERRSAYTRHLS